MLFLQPLLHTFHTASANNNTCNVHSTHINSTYLNVAISWVNGLFPLAPSLSLALGCRVKAKNVCSSHKNKCENYMYFSVCSMFIHTFSSVQKFMKFAIFSSFFPRSIKNYRNWHSSTSNQLLLRGLMLLLLLLLMMFLYRPFDLHVRKAHTFINVPLCVCVCGCVLFCI